MRRKVALWRSGFRSSSDSVFQVAGAATAKARRPYTCSAGTLGRRASYGWLNGDAVVQRLELIVYWLNCRTLVWDVFGPFFVGGLAYADDLVLLSPSPTAMRKMFSICDEYAAELSIKFNANKSKWLAIIPRKHHWLASHLTFCQFHVEDHHITRVSSFTHLGHIINSELLTKRR